VPPGFEIVSAQDGLAKRNPPFVGEEAGYAFG